MQSTAANPYLSFYASGRRLAGMLRSSSCGGAILLVAAVGGSRQGIAR